MLALREEEDCEMVIMPKVEKYEVYDYVPKLYGNSWSLLRKEDLLKSIDGRKFKLLESFDNLEDAREFISGTEYIIQYVFKELPEDADNG